MIYTDYTRRMKHSSRNISHTEYSPRARNRTTCTHQTRAAQSRAVQCRAEQSRAGFTRDRARSRQRSSSDQNGRSHDTCPHIGTTEDRRVFRNASKFAESERMEQSNLRLHKSTGVSSRKWTCLPEHLSRASACRFGRLKSSMRPVSCSSNVVRTLQEANRGVTSGKL